MVPAIAVAFSVPFTTSIPLDIDQPLKSNKSTESNLSLPIVIFLTIGVEI